MMLDLVSLLDHINQQYGTAFTLLERYTSGEQGAFALADTTGARFVLKCYLASSQLDAVYYARTVSERLRQVGYPAPEYILIGRVSDVGYMIQRALPGVPMRTLTASRLPQILNLNALQADQALPRRQVWPAPVADPVLYGGEGFCLLEPLRTYSSASAELLQTLQAIVHQHADAMYPTGDIVHFDFNPGNILVTGEAITGVVDWEGSCAGDRMFDLATLLFYNYDVEALRAPLVHVITERAGPGPLRVYLAHLMLRHVDWSIRHHDRKVVQYWLGVAERILRAMPGGV